MGRLIVGDDVVRLSVVGALARRRWRLLAVLAGVGAVIGFGLSFVLSPGHLASSKVLLKGQPDKNQLLTETQVAMSLVVLDRVADDLQSGVRGIDLQGAVTATVLDGNVIEIAGVAPTTDQALALTDRAAAEYVAASTQIRDDTRQATEGAARQRHDAAQKRIDDLRAELATLQADPATVGNPDAAGRASQLATALSAAEAELAELNRQAAQREDQPSSSGNAAVLEPALDRGAAAPTPVQLGAGGAVLGALLGLYGLLWARRRGGRLVDHDQIAAAIGAPVIADVTVAASDLPAGDRTEPARRSGLSRWLHEEPGEAQVQVDPHGLGETTRYRRALVRIGLTVAGPLRLLVVVSKGDEAAQAAVAHLATVAATARGHVDLVADDLGTAEAYRRLAGDGSQVGVVTATEHPSGETVFRVVGVDPARPTVPDDSTYAGVLVVTAAGTRTSDELIDIAGACLDAGSAVTGAVVVTVSRSATPQIGRRPENGPAHPGAGRADDALVAGSS
jgi:hypothetical protein